MQCHPSHYKLFYSVLLSISKNHNALAFRALSCVTLNMAAREELIPVTASHHTKSQSMLTLLCAPQISQTEQTAFKSIRQPWTYNKDEGNVNNCPTRCDYTVLLYSADSSTCFGWYLHPSSGAHLNCNYNIWHWLNHICYCPLTWRSWNMLFRLLPVSRR